MNKAVIIGMGALISVSTGCINRETNLYEVALSGDVNVPVGMPNTGQVHLEYHHERTVGINELTHPLGEFDRETIPSIGVTSTTLLIPHEEGTGLVVYGWLDSDGDGVLCAPGKPRTEPAGIIVVSGYPAHSLSYSLTLDTPCAGPESLYP